MSSPTGQPPDPPDKKPPYKDQAAIREKLIRKAAKAEKKAAFALLIRQGMSATQAAKHVGVSKPTGLAWMHKVKAQDAIPAPSLSILQREQLAGIFSTIAQSETESAAYRVQAGQALSKVMGYDAPARSMVEVRQVPQSVLVWLDAIDVQAEPTEQIAQSTPPKALTDKASS